MICNGCGGVVGRDCWNPPECEWISRDMAMHHEGQEIQSLRQIKDELLAALKDAHPFVSDDVLRASIGNLIVSGEAA